MKKNKKGILGKIVTTGLIVTASIGLTACGGSKDKNPTITVDTTDYDAVYSLNETFSLEGLKLKIEKANGTVESVDVTQDMIKSMPDMSTAGTKTIIIEYDGVEYTLTIEVVASVVNYSFTGYKEIYKVNESFNIANLKLVLDLSDNTTKTINVTASMINKMPDMSKIGTKIVVVNYEGDEYILRLNVINSDIESVINKFLQEYENKIDTSKITLNYKRDIVSKYLDKEVNFSDETLQTYASYYSLDCNYDALVSHLYETVIKSAVSSSTDLTKLNITSVGDETKYEFKILDGLTNIATNVTDFDYLNYVFYTLLPESNSYYVEYITNCICNYAYIELEGDGYNAVKTVVDEYFTELRTNYNIEMYQVSLDLINLIKKYSYNEYIHVLLNDIDCKDINSVVHFMSTLRKETAQKEYGIVNLQAIINYRNGLTQELQYNTDINSMKLLNDFVNYEVNNYKIIEDAIIELMNAESTTTVKELISQTLDNLISNNNAYKTFIQDMQANDLVLMQGDYSYFVEICSNTYSIDYEEEIENTDEITSDLTEIKETFENEGIISVAQQYGLIEMALTNLGHLSDEQAEVISNVIYDYLKNKKIDDQYITDLSDTFGYDFNSLVETLRNNYEETENYYLLRTIFDNFINLDELEDDEKGMYSSFRSLLVYLDEGVYAQEEIVSMIKECYQSTIDYLKVKYPDKTSLYTDLIEAIYSLEGLTDYAQNLVNEYRDEVIEKIYNYGLDLFDLEGPNYNSAYVKWYELSEEFVDDFINDEIDLNTTLRDILEFVNDNCENDRKTYINSSIIVALSLIDKENIDYNELFSFIELPEEIESIDYNKLVETLKDKDTYKNYQISDVKVEYIYDGEGNITGESLTIILNVDYDVMIASIEGSVELNMIVDFDAI